ncbi:Ribosome biogenesis protein, NOL1/NOP2/fmu family [Candidatus Nanobsidianus stetteri]|uniref:Ribosome biogenesis protein, NOL1/NOP2/fmu family n=1 Tax=Nanobsidianus stetteri TaxID=1294122 RepID=R1E4Y3_NANST|nr:Ribosome biogenesis protein, NOL1/NOP2/fmu family [Candidatus Nanobsidianus stetteri]
MKELNKKNIEEIFKKIEEYYNINIDKSIIKKYRFFINKDKIYMFNKNFPDFLDEKYIKKYGLYVIKIEKNNIYRFSIEGAQIFGINSNKIIEIKKENLFYKFYENIKLEKNYENGFYIAKDGNDILCSVYIKNNILKDFIPKERKINYSFTKDRPENTYVNK